MIKTKNPSGARCRKRTSIIRPANRQPGRLATALSVLLALLVWQFGAMALDQQILLVTPIAVAAELAGQVVLPAFWASIWFSFQRILAGFFLALVCGVLLGALSYRFRLFRIFLSPYIAVIKSVPVASFIILCLIWLSAQSLSVFVSFLIVLPVVYSNVLQGLDETDVQLLEMAQVFEMGFLRRVAYIYLPQLKPYLLSACSAAIGMAWKSGIAAEVIGIPTGSIGERLYQAKVYLSSRELFCWTVVIIAVSVLFEKLFVYCLRAGFNRLER